MTLGDIYLHEASNKVRGDVCFPRDQALSEFGEAAIGHHSQRCMDFLQDKRSHSHQTASALKAAMLSMGGGVWKPES